jgi:hypothetical protein
MSVVMPSWGTTTLALILLASGCNNAESQYNTCLELSEQRYHRRAISACEEAISLDPDSEFAKQAAAKIPEIQSELEAAGAGLRASQEATMKELRAMVSAKYLSSQPSNACLSEGLPPFNKIYGGGTSAENQAVAFDDGCVHRHGESHSGNLVLWSEYCCPN